MKNMIIAQSGGPSTVINASLAGAVEAAMASEKIANVYGALHGMEGLLNRQIINISDQIHAACDLELLAHTPAMALGSCRFKLCKTPDENYEKILEIFKEYNIGYFFYIGGNDSMDTVACVSRYLDSKGEDIKCVGIPKTVDNDLEGTDHTPGFGSAARFVSTSISEINIDGLAYPIPTVTVVEIMGRNAGWLTASSVLARAHGYTAPHLIYLPETVFDPTQFVEDVKGKLKDHRHVVVAVSEGVRTEDGKYLSQAESGEVDMFGHRALGGAGEVLETLVREQIGCKARSVDPSVLQRVGMHLASGVDLKEAKRVGEKAVYAALEGKTAVMIGIKRVSNDPYLVRYEPADIKDVANHERKVPAEWITDNGTNVSQEMIDYLKPLYRGETAVEYEDGLPKFFKLDKSVLVKPE